MPRKKQGESAPKSKLEIVAGRVSRALSSLEALGKTAGYEELTPAHRKKVMEVVHAKANDVLTAFESGERQKGAGFRF